MPTQYYIKRNDKVRGPFSEERIRELHAEGKLRDTDFVSTRSDGRWATVETLLSRQKSAAEKTETSNSKIAVAKSGRSKPHIWIAGVFVILVTLVAGLWSIWRDRPARGEVTRTVNETSKEPSPRPDSVDERFVPSQPGANYRTSHVGETLQIAAESPTQLAALRKKLEHDLGHREYVKATRTGHVIIGRIQLEGGDDPETVRAQTVILPGEFFSDAIANLTDPIGFRRFGYRDIDFAVPADLAVNEEGFIDVGTIGMKRHESPAAHSLSGVIQLEGGEDVGGCEVKLHQQLGPINTINGGYDPGERKEGPQLSVSVAQNGEFTASGLFVGKYVVTIAKTGFISEYMDFVEVGAQEVRTLPPIELSKSRNVSLEFVVRDSTAAEFAAGSIQQTTLSGRTSWNSMPSKDGLPDIRFRQVGQTIILEEAWGNSVLCDLGVAEIREHLQIDDALAKDRPHEQPVIVGHTYLLNQKTRKHAILFRILEITESGAGKAGDVSHRRAPPSTPDIAAELSSKLSPFGGRAVAYRNHNDPSASLLVNIGRWEDSKPRPERIAGSKAAMKAIAEVDYPVKLYLNGDGQDYSVQSLQRINEIPQLQKLNVEPQIDAIDDAFCQMLTTKNQLRAVTLNSPKITDKGLASLAGIKLLDHLELSHVAVSDAGIKSLENHANLQHLSLSNCKLVTDQALTALTSVPQLKRLILQDTGISVAAVSTLRMSRPGLAVGIPGRSLWLSRDDFRADFNSNRDAGLGVTDVSIQYDSETKDLKYSAEWQQMNGTVWYVKNGLTDEQLEAQNATKAAEGYTVSRVRTASMKGRKYHIVLWTRNASASSGQPAQDASKTEQWLKPASAAVDDGLVKSAESTIQSLGGRCELHVRRDKTTSHFSVAIDSKDLVKQPEAIKKTVDLLKQLNVPIHLLVAGEFQESDRAGINEIPAIPSLAKLTIKCFAPVGAVNDEFLKSVGRSQSLRYLEIMSEKDVTDAGFREIAKLPQLEELRSFMFGVSDEGIRSFTGNRSIQRMSLFASDKVTTESITVFDSMPNLKTLHIHGAFKNEAIRKLKAHHPDLCVVLSRDIREQALAERILQNDYAPATYLDSKEQTNLSVVLSPLMMELNQGWTGDKPHRLLHDAKSFHQFGWKGTANVELPAFDGLEMVETSEGSGRFVYPPICAQLNHVLKQTSLARLSWELLDGNIVIFAY